MDDKEITKQLRLFFNKKMDEIVECTKAGDLRAIDIFTNKESEHEFIKDNIEKYMKLATEICFDESIRDKSLLPYTRKLVWVMKDIKDSNEKELFLACCFLVLTTEALVASSRGDVVATA